MEKYPILHICRTARFKIDSYIPKPETFCYLSEEMRLCIITTYCIWETSRFFTVSFYSSLWSWRMIFESGHRGRAGFRRQAWLLTALYLERLGFYKSLKNSVINITRKYTEIFPKTNTKKRHFLPTKDRYSSVRSVNLKGKARCSKILHETLFEFVFLG